MVKGRSNLRFEEGLLEREQGAPRQEKQRFGRTRADNSLAVLLVLTAGVYVLLGFTYQKQNWWAVVLLGILFLASEYFALPMKPGGRISLAWLPLVMAMMVSGAVGCAVVALFGLPVFYMEQGEYGLRRLLYNAAMLSFSAGAAALVFWNTGGARLTYELTSPKAATMSMNIPRLLLPWILATIVFYALNTTLATMVLTPEGERLTRFWVRKMLPKGPSFLLYSAIGFLAAVVYVRLEYAAVVLLFAPLLAVRVVYTRYSTMRDVCDDTTLAIMEAVESGGMFSEGHSNGVSDYAVAIAEEMNFTEEDVHYIRQAALLHDVGRLSLALEVINKPGRLTPEEYEEVRKHPLVAAGIVGREKSFAPVAPTIRHHHEMFDGSGYPDGLSGETIPVGARILAIADAFDAMRRETTYREPLSPHGAASEVVRAKGIQFDPEVVDAFSKVVIARGLWSGALEERLGMPSYKQGARAPEPEQPTLEDALAGPEGAERAGEPGATPGEGIKFAEMQDDIEKDMKEWRRAEGEPRRRDRTEHRKRAGSRRKKGRERPPEDL
ncbi:MAG: HD domain-containing protein [Actinobacteria bacterium]|nr:HD domain-containing protein [Actinomycetota bacterium]MBU1945231.1 HD domain-containing protein [Actinomycetota bacterium]MBU2687803.1 HD domain-containing protein [Actinomycetota bacterium]